MTGEKIQFKQNVEYATLPQLCKKSYKIEKK